MSIEYWEMLSYIVTVFGLPLTPDALAHYQVATGRVRPPAGPVQETWAICGRRAGKNRISAAIAVYLATCRTWRLAVGERGTVLCLSRDRRTAKIRV